MTLAHPGRWRTSPRTMPPRLAVIHDSEGSEGPSSAEALVGFIAAAPQPRPDGTFNVASYHVVFDTDRRIQTVEDHLVAYSAPGANTDGIHGCIPGKAGQTREQWLEPISRAYIRQVARWLVDKSVQYGRDYTRRLTVAEVIAGQVGYCEHKTITDAYHRTDHWDPGPNFPHDVLAADIAAMLAPPQEDDMGKFMAETPPEGTYPVVWCVTGSIRRKVRSRDHMQWLVDHHLARSMDVELVAPGQFAWWDIAEFP